MFKVEEKPESGTVEASVSGEANLSLRIAQEHSYSRLAPFRSSPGSGGRDSSFPTFVLFPDRVKKREASKPEPAEPMQLDQEENSELSGAEEEEEIDVVGVAPSTVLPYDERKVGNIMVECARHINLVRSPAENSDMLLERVMSGCSYQQKNLLQKLYKVLQNEHLARLVLANVDHEPIKRRLHTDKTTKQYRKVMADINWDPKLTQWVHETLLQVLDGDLLPIYLDVLQVLKANCPVLVEHMVHSSISLVGGEAFSLLLKRPWNPAVGMHSMDKQVKFEPAPIFVNLPYATTGLGGRRWRMWQSQLGSIGKVYPIILPEGLSDPGQCTSLKEVAEQMFTSSLTRVQELRSQFPTRPIVLIGFSLAGRIAAKIAEVESISCIISLGLPVSGLHSHWEVSADPFRVCKVPSIFVVGSEGKLSSIDYIESLRTVMNCPTSLVVVGGGDDLLRLSAEDKYSEDVCQSIVDRCILDKCYEFLVHNLPCSYPDEHSKHASRKRKISNTEDIGSTFLTPAITQSSIPLHSSSSDDQNSEGRNYNFNNSNPLWKSFLSGMKQQHVGASGSRSGTPSPIALLEKRLAQEGVLPSSVKKTLLSAVAEQSLPKMGRPRSKSTVDKPKKKVSRLRSKSSDQPNKSAEPSTSGGVPVTIALNSNANNNNSNSCMDSSPPGLFTIPQAHFRPLPITPPRNPFEDQATNEKLDPKTLRHLQRRFSQS